MSRVAKLSRLSLTEEEVNTFRKQLSDILHFVEQLNELDTSDVEPYIQESETTPMRDDKEKGSLDREEALKNAPQREGGFIVVPRIVEV